MKKIKSKIYTLSNHRTLYLEEEIIDTTSINADELIAKTVYTAISPGTEVSAYCGIEPLRDNVSVYPRLVGYCNVAQITHKGSAVMGWSIGDYILTFQSHRTHFKCRSSDFILKVNKDFLKESVVAYLYHLGFHSIHTANLKAGHNVGIIGLGVLGYTTSIFSKLGGGMKAVIDKAIRDWTCLTGINWYLGNDTNYTDTVIKRDTLCLLKFSANLDPSKLAIATSYLSACGGEPVTLESDIRINSTYNWYCDTVYGSFVPSGQKDLYAVILHELGHAHGLKHVIDVNAIMHYATTTGPRKINLVTDNSCDEGGNWMMDYSTALSNQRNCSGILNISRIINPPCSPTNNVSDKLKTHTSFIVFPNPSNNVINIQSQLTSTSPVNLLLFDLSGKIILTETVSISEETITVDVNHLTNGIYILRVQDSKNQIIESFKITKQ